MAVSLRVTGSWAELTADGSVAIPSTPQAGDRMFLFARWKDFSITASVANWTEVTQFADGSVASGNGVGSVKVACWYRDWQSGDSNPTIDFSANPTNASVVIMVMQKGADDAWATPLFRTAAMTNWTTTSQSVSAGSTLAVPGGSVVMGLIGIRDDTATMTRPTNGIDDAAGAITWNGNHVESPATHHSTTTGDDGAADLGYRLVSVGATATLRMTGTISAAETGAALWVVQPVNLAVTPSFVSLSTSGFAPSLKTTIIPANVSLLIAPFAASLRFAVTPSNISLTISTSAPLLIDVLNPASQTLTTGLFAPTVNVTQNVTAVPTSVSLAVASFAPTAFIPSIIFLDPGGDAVQADDYFGLAQGSGTVSFDTAQKVNGVGSWKFDSGVGNGNPHRKVTNVLGASRRINRWVRFDSVPDTSGADSQFTNDQAVYSGGGFSVPTNLQLDDASYATATPAKNGAQGSTLSFTLNVPQDAVIDSIKIIYERKYDTAASIGTSRVRYLVGAEEGPNHDNMDMPTTDTVVTVDITADRTWTHAEVNAIKVIAEALRGDTDTAHTQSWDYVKVEVEYHTAIGILWGQENGVTGTGVILRLSILPTGSGVTFRLSDADAFDFDGITVIPPDEWHRVALCFNQNDTDNLAVKLYVDGIEELSLVERGTGNVPPGGWPDLLYGWIDQPGTNQICWVDQLYIDNGSDLSDPGPIYMTAKLPATVNQDNFDTTGGTGAVNERPVDLANYRQQAGASQQFQNYTLQAADVGDIDISGETLIGYMGWAVAKRGAGPTSTGAGITVNGVTTNVTLLATGAHLVRAATMSASYPSNAAGIGLRSITTGGADAFLYECGAIIAYRGPLEDILFAEYLLLEDQSAEVVDDLRADPPDTYMLRYWIREGGGTVRITAYSITAEGESPRAWPIIESNGGKGQARVAIPGIEVRIVMEVTEADTFVMLQHYFNV